MSDTPASGSADEDDDEIRLDQFLKLCGAVTTGGEAKTVIQDGQVLVNGRVETRRRHKLKRGDRIELDGETWVIA